MKWLIVIGFSVVAGALYRAGGSGRFPRWTRVVLIPILLVVQAYLHCVHSWWIVLSIDGNGHNVYSGYREFEMKWGFMTMTQFNELHGLFTAIGNTGTAVVSLPTYAGASWAFTEYSGTVLQEPKAGEYFEQHVGDVNLLVVKIRTS